MDLSTSKYDKEYISKIKIRCGENDFEIFKKLGFDEGRFNRNGVQQCCPIHGGDNPSAFSYRKDMGIWQCFTHQCEQEYGSDIIGLVKGILDCGFNEAIEWLEKTLEDKDINGADPCVQRIRRTAKNKLLNKESINRLSSDLSHLDDRVFSKETARFFGAGLSKTQNKFDDRVYIPIFNDEGGLVGFTGRSIYPLCSKCKRYHDGPCPSRYAGLYSKWRHYPKGFQKSLELYNINNAKEAIYKTNTCIVVEGPYDVWNLWEKGVKNVVATFGISLSYEQTMLLSKHGCINLILLYDPDNDAKKAVQRVYDNTKDFFRLSNIELPPALDPGELYINEVEKYVLPIIKRVTNNA